MATANEQLLDMQISQQHLLEQYKNEAFSLVGAFLKRMERLIEKEITAYYDGENPLKKDMPQLRRRLKTIQDRELNKIRRQLLDDAQRFLRVNADVYKYQLDKVFEEVEEFVKIKRVTTKDLNKAFEKDKIVFDKGEIYTLTSFLNRYFMAVEARLEQNIESAYELKKTEREFNSDVRGNRARNLAQLAAVSAVLVQQAYGVSKRIMEEQNDVIRGYVWVAILDSRTSNICLDLNSRIWYFSDEVRSTLPFEIYPPAHFHCRSLTSPITKSYKELGISRNDLSDSQIELLSGGVPEIRSYSSWFNSIPARQQREILGPTRYSAFVNGTPIDKFISNGRRLTLKQLQQKGIEFNDQYLRYIR